MENDSIKSLVKIRGAIGEPCSFAPDPDFPPTIYPGAPLELGPRLLVFITK